ncbi:MAG: hypothetical protein AAGI12_06920 [Pseudomonadota bacterium]
MRSNPKRPKGQNLMPSIIVAAFVSLTLLLVIIGSPTQAQGSDHSWTGWLQTTQKQVRSKERRGPPPKGAIAACATVTVQSMCSFEEPRGGHMITGTCAMSPRQERLCIPNDPTPNRG